MAGEDHFVPQSEPNLLEEEEPDKGKYCRSSSFIEMQLPRLPSVKGLDAHAQAPLPSYIPAPLYLAPIERNAPPRNAPEIDQPTDDETDTESVATDEESQHKPEIPRQ